MTLTTHAITGALIGAVAASNVELAIVMAILSHPLMDSIPHWDYSLSSGHEDTHNALNNDIDVKGKNFIIDLVKIGFDFCLGLAIVGIMIFIYHPSMYLSVLMIVCALVAVAPDPLQFVYMKTRSKIIEPFQRFHMYLHAKTRLGNRPILGIGSQAVIIIILLVLMSKII